MPLLERAPQLEELGRHLHDAVSGQGTFVLVAGEAGIGKTSLVDAFCDSASDVRVLRGACDPFATPRPLGPLIDMLAELGEGFAELVWSGAPRERVFRALLEELSTGDRVRVLVFEDAHWADDATLDLLRYLGRRIGAARVLVLVTYRDDEVGPKHPLRVVLGDLVGIGSTRRMRLAPLSVPAMAELAQGTSRDVDAAELHARTGGNPFYATEILAVAEGKMPENVVDAVLARAGRLSHDARRALDAAAVIGPRSGPDLLQKVADVSLAEIEACLASGMLVPSDRGVAFRHELSREALVGSLPAVAKVGFHRRVLEELLVSEPGSPTPDYASLAHHAEGAGDVDVVLRYAPLAGRQAAAMHAHREAVGQYARALRFAGRLSDAEHVTLLEAYAQESHATDRVQEAIETYREAVCIRRGQGELGPAAIGLSRMARLLVVMGRNAESEQAVHDAIELVDQTSDAQARALTHMTWAYLRMLNRDTEAARSGAEQALELARASGDEVVAIQAHNVLGCVLVLTGRHGDGREALQESMRLAEASGRDELAAEALRNLGTGFGEMYCFAEADRWLARGIDYCSDRDLDYQRMYMLSWRALSHAHQGRWVRAAEDATVVVRRPGTASISRIMALVALGRIRSRRGDPEARGALDEALELADVTGTLQRVGPVRAARAELAWLEGDSARCAREARAAYALALAKAHPWFVGELAYWRWKAGDLDTVPDIAADPYRWQIEGRWADAAAAWAELLCPYEQARALAESHDAHAAAKARLGFAELGARPALEHLAARAGHGDSPPEPRGPRASTLRNPAGLTNRQVDVLRLVADGLTNAEIAERLFRSGKTVEHHLTAIFTKLDVRNRTEAAQRSIELGLSGR